MTASGRYWPEFVVGAVLAQKARVEQPVLLEALVHGDVQLHLWRVQMKDDYFNAGLSITVGIIAAVAAGASFGSEEHIAKGF